MNHDLHTPAPWVIARAGEANPKPCGIRSEGKPTGMICHIPTEHESAEANARLIAAAPELLAALRELRDFYREATGLPAARANAAIHKAETGSNP